MEGLIFFSSLGAESCVSPSQLLAVPVPLREAQFASVDTGRRASRVWQSLRTSVPRKLDLKAFFGGFVLFCPDSEFFLSLLLTSLTLGYISERRALVLEDASRTQIVLGATTGFFFQTAVSHPHRIPRPECGYAAVHRQHHHPPGRHGDHKVRESSSNFPPPSRLPPGRGGTSASPAREQGVAALKERHVYGLPCSGRSLTSTPDGAMMF